VLLEHSAHPAEVAVPGLVTEPEKAAAHVVQAATDVLPRATVETPKGQAEQLVAPEAAKKPRSHAAQPAALSAPGCATALEKPGEQVVHADAEVLPTEAVEVPNGHAVQLASPEAAKKPIPQAEQDGSIPLSHAQVPSVLLRESVASPDEPANIQAKVYEGAP